MGLAKMQVITPDVDPEDDAGDVQERPEELRLLEAMLFAASEPLSGILLRACRKIQMSRTRSSGCSRTMRSVESISCASPASGLSARLAICRGS